jgi:octaprenyl-diphosphate synthase
MDTPARPSASLPLDAPRVRAEMDRVDQVLRKHLHSDVALVQQVAEYIIAGGGKRLRPLLLILAADACAYRGEDHYVMAAVVELIHTATLLHDDVVDESGMRRGKATANALFGNAPSVLVGDFLYSRAFQMMVSLDRMRVLRVLSDATNVIAEGEVMQLMNCGNADLSEDAYLEVIRCKTAKLFEAATRLGAILADAPPAVEAALADYGMHLGTAFQLTDDVLDYSGDHEAIGKNLGDDLAEGKATLPLIHAMRNGSKEDADLVRKALHDGGLVDFTPLVAVLHKTGALAYAHQCAEREAQRARDALAALPDSQTRQSLLKLAVFAADRSF